MESKTYTIDASGKSIGRVATEAAMILMGKNSPHFQNNQVIDHKVVIENASKAKISQKKMRTTEYARFSGFPGGLAFDTMEKIVKDKGYGEIFKKAVYGMLPGNKLRAPRMKNITITE